MKFASNKHRLEIKVWEDNCWGDLGRLIRLYFVTVTWTVCRLRSPATRVFVQRRVHANITLKPRISGHLLGEPLVDYPYKGPVMWKACRSHVITSSYQFLHMFIRNFMLIADEKESDIPEHDYTASSDIPHPIILWWTPFTLEAGTTRTCGNVRCFFTNDKKYAKHRNMKVCIHFAYVCNNLNTKNLSTLQKEAISVFWYFYVCFESLIISFLMEHWNSSGSSLTCRLVFDI